MEKYRRAGQATYDNMAHALFMLDNKGYTNTHTHSEYVILTEFPRQQWFANPPQYYIYTHTTLCVLLNLRADGMYNNHRVLMIQNQNF